MKTILFLLVLGLLEPAPVEVSDWVKQPSADNCKIYYSAKLKTSKWLGYPDSNYAWDGEGLSWEREVIGEDGKKTTVKTYKEPIEIIADLKSESVVYGIEGGIEKVAAQTFGGPLKDFVWLDKVAGGGTVLLPFTAEHIFIAKGDRFDPVLTEISTDTLEANYYEIVEGKTRVFVTSFSGMGGAAGAPPNLIAHYKMNENTASDNAELVTGGTFAIWTADNPDGWTVNGEVGDDPEVSEAATGESHADTPTPGGGMCNIYSSGAGIEISQTLTLVVGRKYRFSINIDTATDGAIQVYDSEYTMWTAVNYGTKGIQTFTFVATYTDPVLVIKRIWGDGDDITFDDVSVKLCAIEDSSGNDHDGVAQQDSDAISAVGVVKTGLEFNGTSDYIIVPDHDDFTPAGTPFSISAWVNMDDATSFSIASKGVYNTDGEWRFSVSSGDYIYLRCYDESVASCRIGRYYGTTMTSYEGEWIHVVAVYDGGNTNSSVKLYLESVHSDDNDFGNNESSFVAIENLTHNVWIGRYDNVYANGKIDNVYFFAAELTQDEVNILYNGGAGTEIPAELDQKMSPRRANLSPFSLRRRYEY